MMPTTNDLRAILTAAEQAVGRDDAAAAERLLRDALALQESDNGSPRDEVAKTLNNLAVVCEMTGKIGDAETCYRRAYAIATATLPASDPFVTTSRENLEEFCKSQGIPFDKRSTSAPRPQAPAAPKIEPALDVEATPITEDEKPAFAPEPVLPAQPPVAEPLRIALEPLRAAPEPPRAAPEPLLAAPEPLRPAPEPLRAAPEPRRAAPEPRRAAPEPRRAAPEPRRAAPEPRRAASEPRRLTPDTPRVTPDTLRPASPTPPPARDFATVPAPAHRGSRAIIIAVLCAVAVAGVIVGARYWLTRDASSERAPSTSSSDGAPSTSSPDGATSISTPAPVPAPAPPSPAAAAPEPTSAAPRAETPREPQPAAAPPKEAAPLKEAAPPPVVATAPEPPVTKPEPARTTPSSAPTVVSAQLCRSLSTSGAWRCEPASGTLSRGTIYYFTRVASNRDTQIQHRWYRDDRLHQSVPLRIGANQSGFRTYSRTTMTADRAGNWRVELRTSDGRVLDEETFTVR